MIINISEKAHNERNNDVCCVLLQSGDLMSRPCFWKIKKFLFSARFGLEKKFCVAFREKGFTTNAAGCAVYLPAANFIIRPLKKKL